MAKKKVEMDIINLRCVGITIGIRSHFVAVEQALQDVTEFGVYVEDLTDICLHFNPKSSLGLIDHSKKGRFDIIHLFP